MAFGATGATVELIDDGVWTLFMPVVKDAASMPTLSWMAKVWSVAGGGVGVGDDDSTWPWTDAGKGVTRTA